MRKLGFVWNHKRVYRIYKAIELKFIQPSCPTQNSRVERFNGSMRREFFNAYLFYTLDEVKIMVKEWIIPFKLGWLKGMGTAYK